MFILPITEKSSWRNPPIVTIGIICVNLFVLFFFQSGEKEMFNEALNYYFDSGLAEIEVGSYVSYLSQKNENKPLTEAHAIDKVTLINLHTRMEKDLSFIHKLNNFEIISETDPVFRQWQRLRAKYENKLSKIPFIHYGFRPAYKMVHSFFTYMFLHGSLFHLIGNMVFLWLVGCALESVCGRGLYLTLYLTSGVVAVVFFYLVYSESTIPLIGASGAISGLMGIYTVLFGKRKVNIFFSLGFYFNYARIGAIILLPVWITNEIFQLIFTDTAKIAYMAHIGGLLGGALIGGGLLLFSKKDFSGSNSDESGKKEEDVHEITAQALNRIGRLDLENGRILLEKALEKDPENLSVLIHLFNVNKNNPGNIRFHSAATRLLSILTQEKERHDAALQIYKEYTGITRQRGLPPSLYFRLGQIFIDLEEIGIAAQVLTVLLKKSPEYPGLPEVVAQLGFAFKIEGNIKMWRRCHQVIVTKYPASKEAAASRQLLKAYLKHESKPDGVSY